MVIKICEGIWCSSLYVKEPVVIVHKIHFSCMTLLIFWLFCTPNILINQLSQFMINVYNTAMELFALIRYIRVSIHHAWLPRYSEWCSPVHEGRQYNQRLMVVGNTPGLICCPLVHRNCPKMHRVCCRYQFNTSTCRGTFWLKWHKTYWAHSSWSKLSISGSSRWSVAYIYTIWLKNVGQSHWWRRNLQRKHV